MGRTSDIEVLLVCPSDGAALTSADSALVCASCGTRYGRGAHGYFEVFAPGDPAAALETAASHPATGCDRSEARLYRTYLHSWLEQLGARRVLDAGCGPGLSVAAMLEDGFDAYGIDLPVAAAEWSGLAHDRDHYLCGNVTRLPFGDATFDAVMSIGVVEHIGTTTGHVTLAPAYGDLRVAFARELLRVTRPGGHILLSCPNKRFPIDVQHGPRDADTSARLRTKVFERTGLNVHPVVGKYHLASYSDVRRWFRGHEWRALPLDGFFGFTSFRGGRSRAARFARRYVKGLPAALRRTALNPYVLVEVTA